MKKLFFLYFVLPLFVCVGSLAKIPHIMHTLWLGKTFPTHYHMFRLEWMKKHPHWTHILWVDNPENYIYGTKIDSHSFQEIIDGKYAGKLIVIDVNQLSLQSKKIYESGSCNDKSTIARYMIMYLFGGAYINADCECIKSFDVLHENYDFYAGQSINENNIFLSNAIFGAIARHPLAEEALLYALKGSKCLFANSFPEHKVFQELISQSKKSAFLAPHFFYSTNLNTQCVDEQKKKSFLNFETMAVCYNEERLLDHSQIDNKHVIGLHNGNEGLFSVLKGTIHHLSYCLRYNKTPIVFWDESSSYYQPEGFNGSTNVWEYYFEPASNVEYQKGDYVWRLYGAPDNTGIDIEAAENRERKFRKMVKETIINRFIKIKPHIQSIIDSFYEKNIKNKRTIGIHIRNTDRSSLPGQVSFQRIMNEAKKYDDGITQFFIATDEERFLTLARKQLRGHVIAYDSYRSKDGEPIHISKKHGYGRAMLGQEALIEVLLLSQCDLFIHTISNFSYASLLFNPDLDSILLK